MQVRELSIRNYRGIKTFTWRPSSPLTCIVGPGDSCKSTILDAIEIALGTRWFTFTDVDFYNGDTTAQIEVIITLGQLPKEALQEGRFGLYLRGWKNDGGIRDEPEDTDESVVTIRLTVDSTLEPSWDLITDRSQPRPLSQRDRSLFGVVRLGGDSERHLTWGQGSALTKLSAEREQAAPLLAEAYRKARDLLKAGTLPSLDAVAKNVRDGATTLGAYVGTAYSAGLDTQRSSMSLGSLSMHSDGIPLRLSGLGTRRLVALAVQQMSIPEGAVVLIDEIEHGLEPHRIRHTLKVLRKGLSGATPMGQVILTTHSATTVVELTCKQLAICRCNGGTVDLRTPADNLQALIRRVAEAFLSRSILVCEGKTEVGMFRGLRDFWAGRHDDEPIEAKGVVLADGNGNEAVATASGLAQLGYKVALFRDTDVALSPAERTQLQGLSIEVFEWADGLSTEQRVFLDISEAGVQALLDLAFEFAGEQSVLDTVKDLLGAPSRLPRTFSTWAVPGKSKTNLRTAIGKAAKSKNWFKIIDRGERMGQLVAQEIQATPGIPTAQTITAAETWAYDR
jgi:hypothetical protein